MKIGVVGTFIRDKIYPWQGQPADSIGGIFFTTSYLANLAPPGADIVPVCNLGGDFYPDVIEELSKYPNVILDGVQKHPQTNTQVTLKYTGPQDRDEVTTAVMPPVDLHQLQLLSDADAVIFNLITGEDVSLTALQQFRKQTRALLYLDFHTRCLAIDENGKRYYRRPEDWQEWVRSVDILQLNEMEAQTLGVISKPLHDAELRSFGEQVLGLGPSICNITLAERGSLLSYRNSEERKVFSIPPVFIPDVQDMIGCGDAFEAAFVLNRLQDMSEIESAKHANLVAAINTTFVGSSGIKRIKEKIASFNLTENVQV